MRRILPPLLFLAGAVAGFLLSRHLAARTPVPGTITVKVDTLYLHDTLRVDTPVIVERRVVDTMTVEVTDYLVVHDTAFVNLPREEVEYRDSSYRAIISGFNPRLEEIELYPQKQIITIQTETVKTVTSKARWGVGIQAGVGATKGGLYPYIGVGVSYNLINFIY